MKKSELLHEGKAKKVYATDNPDLYIVEYKDDATAFNGEKKGTIKDKGIVNNRMSNFLFRLLAEAGVPNHFAEELGERETAVRRVKIVPLEVIVRNIAAGSFSKRFGVAEGTEFARPTLEYCLKDDALGDPMINDSHILALNLATEEELETIASMAFKVNEVLKEYFAGIGVILVDFKLEFGRTDDGKILLADEISPDTCRLWDSRTKEKLDKDRFRRDLGKIEEAYFEMFRRLGLSR